MNNRATNKKAESKEGDGKKPTLDLKALRASLRDPTHKGFQGQRFNRYDLLSEIARGGMGVVFRAKHVELGSLVALKLLASDPTPDAAGRFRREAKVLAQLKHPNVVGISDLGAEDGVHFLAMELIEGTDLHQIVSSKSAKNKFLPYARVVEIVLAMAKALDYCHEQGAVHRDIKPQNILIERKTDRPVLTDFGLVKRDKSKMQSGKSGAVSQAGTILGTPSFMSPEQFEPDGIYGKVGAKSDVWGLGATLFYLLTGDPPFRAGNVVELYGLVLNEPPALASGVRPGVPEILDELVGACLAKPVAQRISMPELVRRLEEVQKTPKALDGSASSSGMRHAIMIILLFVVLAIFDLAVLEQDKGARLWAQLTGQSVAKEDDLDVSDVEPAQDVAPTDAEVEAMVSRGKALAGSDAAGDRQEAANLFRTAAKHDSSEAMFRLGRLYMKGVGVEQNDAAAVTWLTDAANAADPSLTAMLWLGKLDRESNPKQAVAWFKRVLENAGEGDQIARVKAEKQLERLLAKHKDLGQ